MNIEQLNAKLLEDVKVSEYSSKKIVFGEGSRLASIFMIGEAPGGDEEKQGRPFVGKAGKNLNEFLDVVGLKRDSLYISNVVKLRPTGISPKTGRTVNRTPNQDEVSFFLPYLLDEIKCIEPKLIVTLGNVPLKAVTGDKKASVGEMHGKLYEENGLRLFPLYHPASIIYNQSLKEVYQQDLEQIRQYLD